jgi:hypothetical protein
VVGAHRHRASLCDWFRCSRDRGLQVFAQDFANRPASRAVADSAGSQNDDTKRNSRCYSCKRSGWDIRLHGLVLVPTCQQSSNPGHAHTAMRKVRQAHHLHEGILSISRPPSRYYRRLVSQDTKLWKQLIFFLPPSQLCRHFNYHRSARNSIDTTIIRSKLTRSPRKPGTTPMNRLSRRNDFAHFSMSSDSCIYNRTAPSLAPPLTSATSATSSRNTRTYEPHPQRV